MKLKRTIAFILAIVCVGGCMLLPVSAEEADALAVKPMVSINTLAVGDDIQASGLIFQFYLSVNKIDNTTLCISGLTDCDAVVVKCGFKNLKVQRRANSSSSWSDYYDFGNLYRDTFGYYLSRDLTVEPGYQYRATCKHYAKKNILSTQTISNTSNIVTF